MSPSYIKRHGCHELDDQAEELDDGGLQVLVPSKELASKHYAEHDGKPFFPKLVDFLSSGAVVATVWEGKEVVKYGRTLIGATNPLASAPGTIRCVNSAAVL